MAYTQTYIQVATTPQGSVTDSGASTTADTTTSVDTTVAANGGAANPVAIAFLATDPGVAGLQSIILLATVNCVVTFSGATSLDGVTTGTPNCPVTLTANVMRRVSLVAGNVTGLSVGANTTGSGPAGTITINALFYS